MANMIKFYRGLVNSLPTTGENGALYITTDEGAIYYGTGTGMKRLGDFVQVDAIANLPSEGANTSALYYCVAENVLAKWNGSGWTQVNKQPTADEMKTLLGLGSLAYKSEVAEGDLNADLKAKVNAAAEGNHSHANKALLDTYTQTEANLADAVSKKHSHDNAAELAKIADGDVAKWNNKVDKVDGKSLVDDAEIIKLAGVSAGANKVEASTTNGKIKIDGVETTVYTHPDKHAISDVTGLQDALDGLQAKGDYAAEVHTHVAADITNLDSTIKGYDYATKTEAQAMADGKDEAIAAAQKTADDIVAYVGEFTASEGIDTVVDYIDAKTANIASDERVNGIDNRVKAIEDDYVVAADIADFETKDNVKKVADDLAAYVESNDEALAGVKATAEAARTEDEVNSQIDTKIAALNLGTTYEPIGAETRAKSYVDQKFTDANLAQYTTEQEVKDIVDGVIAGAADSETYNSLTKLVDYIDAHGGEATEMASAIDTLEGKVDTIEKKPAYGITDTQISNWDGEVGAKALAETKLDASTFTEYSNAHAGDYTNKQIDDAIDADVKAAIDAEVLRANGAYDAKGAAADAQAAAIADAAGKYETKGTAQGIVDGLKLSETYEPIGSEGRAIAAAKTETENQVKALADTVYTKTEVEALLTWGEF